MIQVAKDEAGIRRAARDMFEAELAIAGAAALRKRAPALAEAVTAPEQKLAEGYYAWTGHLLRLDRMLHLQVVRGLRRVTADELRGLSAVAEARREFDEAHPPCAHCAAPQLAPEDTRCWRCWEVAPVTCPKCGAQFSSNLPHCPRCSQGVAA